MACGHLRGDDRPRWLGVHSRVQEDWFIRQKFDSKMPGGENFRDIQARFTPFIDGLIQGEQNSDRTVVLVAHGGLYLAMLPVIFTNVSFAFAQEHGFPYTAYAAGPTRTAGCTATHGAGSAPDG